MISENGEVTGVDVIQSGDLEETCSFRCNTLIAMIPARIGLGDPRLQSQYFFGQYCQYFLVICSPIKVAAVAVTVLSSATLAGRSSRRDSELEVVDNFRSRPYLSPSSYSRSSPLHKVLGT